MRTGAQRDPLLRQKQPRNHELVDLRLNLKLKATHRPLLLRPPGKHHKMTHPFEHDTKGLKIAAVKASRGGVTFHVLEHSLVEVEGEVQSFVVFMNEELFRKSFSGAG